MASIVLRLKASHTRMPKSSRSTGSRAGARVKATARIKSSTTGHLSMNCMKPATRPQGSRAPNRTGMTGVLIMNEALVRFLCLVRQIFQDCRRCDFGPKDRKASKRNREEEPRRHIAWVTGPIRFENRSIGGVLPRLGAYLTCIIVLTLPALH
jgi:hypothetical protein